SKIASHNRCAGAFSSRGASLGDGCTPGEHACGRSWRVDRPGQVYPGRSGPTIGARAAARRGRTRPVLPRGPPNRHVNTTRSEVVIFVTFDPYTQPRRARTLMFAHVSGAKGVSLA